MIDADPEFTTEDSYIDENGVRVITKARPHSVSVVPEAWLLPKWRQAGVVLMEVVENDDKTLDK